MKHKVLVTGGGGFIGTQLESQLVTEGYDVTIVDKHTPTHYFTSVYRIADYLDFFKRTEEKFDTVIHLAADHIVPKSVHNPSEYYENNVVKMKALLDLMVQKRVSNIIFSSSGNTYGRQGANGPLIEDLYYDPENPYASTKVTGELLIKDYARAYGLKYVNFRYFNAAGADPYARSGYTQRPATHVIPILCNKILKGESFPIFGTDYPTKDGTCVRDYVHVADLARAHLYALDFLDGGQCNETFNIGGGSAGVSVKELVSIAAEIVGKDPVVDYQPRRPGDPASLVADISKAAKLLEWVPQYTIKDAISHAWEWEKKIETSN